MLGRGKKTREDGLSWSSCVTEQGPVMVEFAIWRPGPLKRTKLGLTEHKAGTRHAAGLIPPIAFFIRLSLLACDQDHYPIVLRSTVTVQSLFQFRRLRQETVFELCRRIAGG